MRVRLPGPIDRGGLEVWFAGTSLAEALAKFSWHRFLAIQVWLFVLFLIYVTFSELNLLADEGELRHMLFNYRSAELIRGRRERTQALVQLSHLTASHTPEELADRASQAHAELLQLLRGLSKGLRVTPPWAASPALSHAAGRSAGTPGPASPLSRRDPIRSGWPMRLGRISHPPPVLWGEARLSLHRRPVGISAGFVGLSGATRGYPVGRSGLYY